jgi:hypothetical protein
MKIQKTANFLLSVLFGLGCLGVAYGEAPYAVTIPVGGNSWVRDTVHDRDRVITAKAIENWSSQRCHDSHLFSPRTNRAPRDCSACQSLVRGVGIDMYLLRSNPHGHSG